MYDAETESFNEQFLSFLAATPVVQLIWVSDDAVPESATLAQLFAVLPHAIQVCVNVFVRDFDVACSMLRLEPPFAALCPHYVGLELDELQRCEWQTFAHLLQSNEVTRLNLIHTDLSAPEDLHCIVDAALAVGMTSVRATRALSARSRNGCSSAFAPSARRAAGAPGSAAVPVHKTAVG